MTTEKKRRSKKNDRPKDDPSARGMRMRISTRLFLWIMVVITLFVAIIIVVDTTLMNYFYALITVLKMYDIDSTVNEMYQGPTSDYIDTLHELELEFNISIEIFDENGVLIYSTDSAEAVYGTQTNQALIKNYGTEDEGSTKFTMPSGRERTFELKTYKKTEEAEGVKFFIDTIELENGYRLKTYTSLASIQDGANISLIVVVLTSIVMIVFALIVVRLFTQRLTRPLNEIVDITHGISLRDFSKRCPPSNTIEIDTLSKSVNALSESLSFSIEELKEKNAQLQADYEKEKELEEIRTNFITGVSHELKTPIAIIRGYAEGLTYLVESDPTAAKQYSETIIGETERMNDLVMRLLEILKYQSGEYNANEEELDIHEIVQDWFSRNAEVLAGKNISYVNEIPEGITGVGDSMLISSVVNNYLSNGVSHIDGERVLRASAEDLGEVYRVYLFNTGKPIADKDIEMIWNSFYRADKSMSRKEGRFGLGLTIVASIQKLHGMDYGVRNDPDGVSFWFDVKKA